MSGSKGTGGDDGERYTPRPGDEIVEPLFGALRPDSGADPGGPRSTGGLRRLLGRLRHRLGRRRAEGQGDWFVCPVCGAEVPSRARSCRECGSDETTGWSAATEYDDLDLPQPDGPQIPDTFEEFTRAPSSRSGSPARLLLILLATALTLIVVRAALLLLAS